MSDGVPPATTDRALTPWLALLPVVLLSAMVPAGRPALGVALVVTGGFAARAAALQRRGPSGVPTVGGPGLARALALGAAGTLALAAVGTLLAPPAERVGHDTVYDLGVRLLFALYGVGASLAALTGAPADGERAAAPPTPSRGQVAAIVAGSFLWLAVAHALYVGRYAGPGDEVLYLLQSRMLGEPGLARRIAPELAPFFTVRQMAIDGGRVFTQYPPGWPAVLALFDAAGLRWWSGVILGALGVWLTYLLGVRLRSRLVGAVAAALLAACYWFVQAAATYGAHTVTLVLVAAAALLLLAGESARGGRRAAAWLAGGLLLGVAVTVRPLTGATVGLSLAAWLALRGRLGRGASGGMLAALAAGGVAPVLALLAFNRVVMGSPLRFGYTAVNGALVSMGFGTRGYVSYDPRGCPVVVAAPFTPRHALAHLAARGWDLAALALPVCLLVALLVASRRTPASEGAARPPRDAGARSRWALAAAFLVLPAVHVFYFFSETRFYTELFPFLFVGIAALLEGVWRRDGRAARGLLTLGLAGALAYSSLWLALGAVTFDGRMAAFHAVERARREHGRVALFVADTSTTTRGAFYALYVFNVDRFPGDVVVARDLGPANHLLTETLPGYAPMRLAWDASGSPSVVPLALGSSDGLLPTCGTTQRQTH